MSQTDVKKQENNRPGPGGGGGPRNATAHGKIRIDRNSVKLFVRLMSFMRGKQLAQFITSLALMIVTALVSVRSSTFLGTIIDDYIKPLLGTSSPDFTGLLHAIMIMAGLYLLSILATLCYQLTLVNVSNGVLREIRLKLFAHMQTLPIKYFDTRPYGDIMSIYTNDVDNIRELMSNSIPQVFSSLLTVVTIFVAMIRISLALTGVVIATVIVMYVITIFVGGASSRYFTLRQKSLGAMNAHAEEMLNGIKVVKVFCHEEKAKETFDEKNQDLYKKTATANRLANSLMPIMVNIGNVQYVVLAIVGGSMALGGKGSLTLGSLAAFLLLSKNFSRPVSMISQQINTVVMALAGAGRVFELIDEKPEVDEGDVTLVTENGRHFWKAVNPDTGKEELVPLKGDIRMNDVDFGFTEDRLVLLDISLFANPGQNVAFVGSTG
ncbi:MAG: ABC transporter ATP-binding protein, partial [Firmicutes bacterium]|nr:ABC transporter ATP-binding protein [Bacillota bacterium]